MAEDKDLIKTLEEVEANQKEIEKRNTELEANNTRLMLVVKMSGDERKVFDAMTEEKQGEFLKMSAEDRDKIVKAADTEDDTEDDTDDSEIEKRIAKAVEDATKGSKEEVETLRKRLDTSEAFAKAQADRADTAEFQKKAELELPFYSGSVEERGAVLKAINKSNMTDVEKANILKFLKAGNEALKTLTKGVGTNVHTDVEKVDGVMGEVAKAAKDLMAKDSKLTKAAAEAKVYQENPELYKRYLQEQA